MNTLNELISLALKSAESMGASLAEVRAQAIIAESVRADNGVLKEFSRTLRAGIGVRVLYSGRYGFSATNKLSREAVLRAVENAFSAARASEEEVKLAERPSLKDRVEASVKVDPFTVPEEEKVTLVLEVNKAALQVPKVKSAVTNLGAFEDFRRVVASDGTDVTVKATMSGLTQLSVALEAGVMERMHDSEGAVAGWEYIKSRDWVNFSREVSARAAEAVSASTPPAGKFRVVADPRLIGLILHEAFGHALEGDLVYSGASVLAGKLGTQVAAPQVTIVDEGVVDGGYFVPYDDEGNRKGRTVVVEGGVLKSYLTSRATANALGMPVTGNGRAQDFASAPIVRQTNLYMVGGDWSLEEMIEDIEFGLYLTGRGAGGGQVDTAAGTFTFSVGPSRIIRKGELAEMVRGVVVSGMVLETLKGVEAVGKDVKIRTTVFGGCGKEGQIVKVGFGGPHVRIKEVTVGGR